MERCLAFDSVENGIQYTNMAHETVIQELNDLNVAHN